MINKYITESKCFICDTMRYGFKVSLNRFKFDKSKEHGYPDSRSLQNLHAGILSYLKKKYGTLLNNYSKTPFNEGYAGTHRNTIWVFWWQGLEHAPELVKTCISSLHRMNRNHNIIILDQNNFTEYVKLPDYIISKLEHNIISITMFSDILRMNLLNQYGGIWVDSTILCTAPIPQQYFSQSFYTPKSHEQISECVANYKWALYMISGNARNTIFQYMVDFYNLYFKDHISNLHYFLSDYALQLAYDNIPNIRKALKDIPINNEMRGSLTGHLCDIYTEMYSIDSLKDRAQFYKLFWKEPYTDYTPDGSPTVWQYLKNYYKPQRQNQK